MPVRVTARPPKICEAWSPTMSTMRVEKYLSRAMGPASLACSACGRCCIWYVTESSHAVQASMRACKWGVTGKQGVRRLRCTSVVRHRFYSGRVYACCVCARVTAISAILAMTTGWVMRAFPKTLRWLAHRTHSRSIQRDEARAPITMVHL